MKSVLSSLRCVACLALALAATATLAQPYPDKPIHIVVPFAAGGGLDGAARKLGQALSARMGQPVVVENKPGGNGIIATTYVARAKPDGYTLYLTVTTPYSMLPSLYKRPLGYDPEKDYTAVALVAEFQTVFFANPAKNIKTMGDYVQFAKSNPGKLTYASTGSAQILTLATELFKSKVGADLLQVPFQGSAPALQAVVAGDVDSALLDAGGAAPFIQSGKLTGLAVLGNSRISALPDVPTLQEAGVSGVDIPMIWIGIVGPGGLPQAVVAKLNAEINEVLRTPDMRSFLAGASLTPLASTPLQMDAQIRSDRNTWGAVVRRLGLQLE
ncbi:MAG: hypothetical protein JWQ76_4454 [Ramlibacter sp.]|nr:hypothetical protein [Ramlibacter sp.]